MIDQLPLQGVAALGADQGIFPKGFLKALGQRRSGPHPVAVGVDRPCGSLGEGGQSFSVSGVTGIGVQAVVADALESLG